jgi:hypothetical protein
MTAPAPTATGVAWATIQDVEDLIGPVDDTERCQRLLERATGIVAAYICKPLEPIPIDEVPPPVREAVAVMTARAMTGSTGSAAGGTLAGETIGAYTYRYTMPASAIDAMRITPDLAELLSGYRCGGGSASVSVCDTCGCGSASCGCGYPAPGTSYAWRGGKVGNYSYVMEPANEVGSPFNSGRPGRWWREAEPPGGQATV